MDAIVLLNPIMVKTCHLLEESIFRIYQFLVQRHGCQCFYIESLRLLDLAVLLTAIIWNFSTEFEDCVDAGYTPASAHH